MQLDRYELELLQRTDVQSIMATRCKEQDHQYEGACSIFLQIYMICKWCGAKKY